MEKIHTDVRVQRVKTYCWGEGMCHVSPLAQVHFIECDPSLYRTDDCASADVVGTLKALISEAASNVYS